MSKVAVTNDGDEEDVGDNVLPTPTVRPLRIIGRPPELFNAAVCNTCMILSKLSYGMDETGGVRDGAIKIDLGQLQSKTECLVVLNEFHPYFEELNKSEGKPQQGVGWATGFMTKDSKYFYVVFRGTKESDDFSTDLDLQQVATVNGYLPYVLGWKDEYKYTDEEIKKLGEAGDEENIDTCHEFPYICRCTTLLISHYLCCDKCSTQLKRGEAWIHSGFAYTYSSVQIEINRQVKLLNTDNLPVVITGHSLGGALAVLSALSSWFPVHSVYTFGQPKIAGPSLYSQLEKKRLCDKIFRIVHNRDPVSCSPPGSNFSHFGESVIVDLEQENEGTVYFNMPNPKHKHNCCGGLDLRYLNDHGTLKYLDSVASLKAAFAGK